MKLSRALAFSLVIITIFMFLNNTKINASVFPLSWEDMPPQYIAAGAYHTVGIKPDNTVIAVGLNNYGQIDVETWTDIVQVAAGTYHTVGLKSDGTVVAVGDNSHGQLNVSSWTDVVQVAAGDIHTVGLKADGTVVATGSNHHGQLNVSSWR